MGESYANDRGETFKEGDTIIILDGQEMPGPSHISFSAGMRQFIGQKGQINSFPSDGDGIQAFLNIKGAEGYWWDLNWITPAEVPFSLDAFAKYLKTPVEK